MAKDEGQRMLCSSLSSLELTPWGRSGRKVGCSLCRPSDAGPRVQDLCSAAFAPHRTLRRVTRQTDQETVCLYLESPTEVKPVMASAKFKGTVTRLGWMGKLKYPEGESHVQ
jgi:hypothetical protein